MRSMHWILFKDASSEGDQTFVRRLGKDCYLWKSLKIESPTLRVTLLARKRCISPHQQAAHWWRTIWCIYVTKYFVYMQAFCTQTQTRAELFVYDEPINAADQQSDDRHDSPRSPLPQQVSMDKIVSRGARSIYRYSATRRNTINSIASTLIINDHKLWLCPPPPAATTMTPVRRVQFGVFSACWVALTDADYDALIFDLGHRWPECSAVLASFWRSVVNLASKVAPIRFSTIPIPV